MKNLKQKVKILSVKERINKKENEEKEGGSIYYE